MKTYAVMTAVFVSMVAMTSGLVGCGGGDDSSSPTVIAVTNAVPAATNAEPAAVVSMTGTWHGGFDGGTLTFSLNLNQSGNVLSGTYVRDDGTGSGPATGEITGDTIDLTTVREPGHVVSQWHGTVNAERTAANGSYNVVAPSPGSGTFSMSK